MKFPAKGGGDFEIAPAGNHLAICNAVVDFGLQPGRGQYPQPKHEIYVRFELPDEQITYTKDGEELSGPMSIGRRFTASMSPKANLRKFIEAWFGKAFPSDDTAADFDLVALLGRKCLLNVTHNESKSNGRTYANIANATPLPKGMKSDQKQYNESLFFDLAAPDSHVWSALPEWMQKVIQGRIVEEISDEARERVAQVDDGPPTPPVEAYENDDEPFDDDIPF